MEISVCIPAFKRVEFLKRLLDSIVIQTFENFEVIITDDSNDDSVRALIESYGSIRHLIYHKNETVKGTPENWNEAIRRASGEWIKLMHDDDWFSEKDALKKYHAQTIEHPDSTFFFSGFNNVFENGKVEQVYPTRFNRYLLKKSPFFLFKKQSIGNPSCTLIKKNELFLYDNRLKWVVDFEYYIRYLLEFKKFTYINDVLVNIGINEQQVTRYTFHNPEVEMPENHILLRKFGTAILRNIFTYDYYWRMYRNLKIRSMADVKQYENLPIPEAIVSMVNFQQKIPSKILFTGIFSKFFMSLSYLYSLLTGKIKSSK